MDTRKIEDVPFEEVHEIQRYGTYFSEKSFWKKIERVAKKVGATVLRPVFTLYYMLQDEKVPLQHKAYIIGALGYFILPSGLIGRYSNGRISGSSSLPFFISGRRIKGISGNLAFRYSKVFASISGSMLGYWL